MGKVKIEGVEIEIAGDEISEEEFDFIQDLKKEYQSNIFPSGVSEKDINPETGYYNLPEVDSKIRFAVSAAPNFESKIKTLQKFFPKVTQDEYDPTNFIVEDSNGKKFILDDKSKTNFGDVIDEGKGIIKDPSIHQRICDDLLSFCKNSLPHSEIIGHIDSPIKGTDGNKEFLVGLTKTCIVAHEQ